VAHVGSKHAVIGMTKTAVLEVTARGIRVNAAAPDPIAGGMTFKLTEQVFQGSSKTFADTVPLCRHGTPEDVACCQRLPLQTGTLWMAALRRRDDGLRTNRAKDGNKRARLPYFLPRGFLRMALLVRRPADFGFTF
jgi:NAD(P)-dependent dehydrogenase (short-subunit alcohol dehydrogenase family)